MENALIVNQNVALVLLFLPLDEELREQEKVVSVLRIVAPPPLQ
jgi:hypothetical protein